MLVLELVEMKVGPIRRVSHLMKRREKHEDRNRCGNRLPCSPSEVAIGFGTDCDDASEIYNKIFVPIMTHWLRNDRRSYGFTC